MSEQILITKELRLRITDLEYEDLSPEDYVKEIQRIYIEEMGRPLPAEIEIFTSYQSKIVDTESEYVGSAIRFYSEEGGIDEVYIVSEGTQGLFDWLYNIEALMAGHNYDQIEDVNNFMEESLEHFEYEKDNYDIPIVALGHSQAHNTNASAYLIYDRFTSVYGVNGAQLNFYQLFRADPNFRNYLVDRYPILNIDDEIIYTLDSDELKQHALNFYEDKADNIFQERSEQDPLYAVSNYLGFFPLGTDNTYETDSSVPGLSESFDKIDKKFLQKLQKVAYAYAVAVEQGDGLQVIEELLDIDYEFIMNFKIHQYFTQKPKVSETIINLDENLPEVLDIIYEITNNKNSILTELENVGYITSSQKVEIIEVIANIEKQLIIIEESISNMSKARDIIVPDPDAVQLQIDMSSFTKIMDAFDEIQNEIEDYRKMNTKRY